MAISAYTIPSKCHSSPNNKATRVKYHKLTRARNSANASTQFTSIKGFRKNVTSSNSKTLSLSSKWRPFDVAVRISSYCFFILCFKFPFYRCFFKIIINSVWFPIHKIKIPNAACIWHQIASKPTGKEKTASFQVSPFYFQTLSF